MARTAKPAKVKPEPAAGSLAQSIATAPLLSQPDEAQAKVAAWLAGIARSTSGKDLKTLLGGNPRLRDLLDGVADGSPYLWELATADPQRLLRLFEADPQPHLEALRSGALAAVSDAADQDEAMRLLRRMKQEAAQLIALCDIGGVWPMMQVTAALTRLADVAVAAAVRFLLREPTAAGKVVPADPARPEDGRGLIGLAMGKMGAFELNYSSDIDLIILFDPHAPALAGDAEPGSIYLRLARGLVKLLQERTVDGYVFRVDLRLRPDPASTHIAVSTESALVYYESTGQNWE